MSRGHDGEENPVDELGDERVVDRLEAEQHARVDQRRRDVGEERAGGRLGGQLAPRDGALDDAREAAADDLDRVLADQRGELLALAQAAREAGGDVGVLELVGGGLADHGEQVAAQRAGVRRGRLGVRVQADRVGDEGVLAGPAAVDRRLAHAGGRGDRVDRHALIADLGEERERGVADGGVAARVARAAGGAEWLCGRRHSVTTPYRNVLARA